MAILQLSKPSLPTATSLLPRYKILSRLSKTSSLRNIENLFIRERVSGEGKNYFEGASNSGEIPTLTHMETHKEIQGETPTSTSKTAVGKGRVKKPIQIEEKVVALIFVFSLIF